ncbi:hypothetical protein F4780DRAFT_733521 [Xylariomycetidae sp. FL0641]|nr:hypothetical protein F4780DRAFT_733521 [Xylariomycetidae sp. FL0641]
MRGTLLGAWLSPSLAHLLSTRLPTVPPSRPHALDAHAHAHSSAILPSSRPDLSYYLLLYITGLPKPVVEVAGAHPTAALRPTHGAAAATGTFWMAAEMG